MENLHYETIAASQTDQVMGTGGAAGDLLGALIIVPATTSPGNVLIQDGGGSEITVFPGGANSVTELKPITVTLNLRSKAGKWQITTGANVSVIAVGVFT